MEFKDGVAQAELFVTERKDMEEIVHFLCDDVQVLRDEYERSCADICDERGEEMETDTEVDYRFCNVYSNLDYLCELVGIEKHRREHWKQRDQDFMFALSRTLHDFTGRLYKIMQVVGINGAYDSEKYIDVEDSLLREHDEWKSDFMNAVNTAMEFYSETLTYEQFTEYMDNVENEAKIFFPDMK